MVTVDVYGKVIKAGDTVEIINKLKRYSGGYSTMCKKMGLDKLNYTTSASNVYIIADIEPHFDDPNQIVVGLVSKSMMSAILVDNIGLKLISSKGDFSEESIFE